MTIKKMTPGSSRTAELKRSTSRIDWAVSNGLIDYATAVKAMEERVAQISVGKANEMIWLLQHPPLYTAGTSASDADLLDSQRFPVHQTGRGGQFTYHGPGQRVVYVMLDLKQRGGDVRAFVQHLEKWIIASLAMIGVAGFVRPDRIGVWIPRPEIAPGHEDKIAAIGIRVRRWVTFHGLSLNVDPVLEHFSGIVPCGIDEFGVTSLSDLGHQLPMETVDQILKTAFLEVFGAVSLVEGPPSVPAIDGP